MAKDDFPTPEEIEAASRPAFGMFPRGRMQRAERFNDHQASADMPVAFTRGRVAGTLGLPGDIESLIRMITGGENVLPNTEYFDKRLPLKIDTPQSRAAGNVGGVLASPMVIRVALGLPGVVKKAATDFVKSAGQPASNVIKLKGGNWVPGSIEKALSGLKGTPWSAIDEVLDSTQMAQDVQTNALNKWIDSNLTRYVKNQMATPEDPVRLLAEQGVTHNPRRAGGSERAVSSTNREWAAGIPGSTPGTVAVSDAAKNWETLADSLVTPVSTRTLVDKPDWVNKLPEGSKIFDFSRYEGTGGPRSLGFEHIIDVLREDVASGRIRPEQLSKVSMEQAVRRVAEYDAEKAAAMQKAALEQQAGLPTFKEYPTVPGTDLPNQKGLKWVNIAGEDKEKVGKSLKYEGDTMGHCVGGYCDSVMRGDRQIYSLRDAKGEPHVTIEVRPPEGFAGLKTEQEFLDFARKSNPEEVVQDMLAAARKEKTFEPRIIQIKGKQNQAPKEQYLPFVQDFVKSGKWSGVGDIQNSGLRPSKSVFNDTERQTLASKGVTDLPEYLAPDEINQYQRMFDDKLLGDLGVERYASGGRVSRNAPSMADAARGLFDMGASTLRGGVAGLAGLPGDLEGLARSLFGAEDKTPVMPTSDFYKEWLPKASQDPVMDRTFGGIGEILGAPPVGKALSAGTTTLAKELAPTAARLTEQRLANQGLLLGAREHKMLQGLYRGMASSSKDGERIFATPQKGVADYYAKRRAAETGGEPQVEMVMVDPNAGGKKSLSIPIDEYNREFSVTQARNFDPSEIERRDVLGGDLPELDGYAAGGTVKVAKEGVDLLRRKFFGGPALTKTELAVSPTSIESKTVEEGPAAVEKVVQKIEETPMTRRQLLSRAASSVASPMLQRGLPAELAKLSVSNIAKSMAAPALPTTMPGLMAYAIKKGVGEEEAIRFVRANMVREDGMLEDLITGLKSPYAIEMEEPAGRLDIMRQVMGGPSTSMKQVLREVRAVDPEAYGRMKNFATDISKYGFEE